VIILIKGAKNKPKSIQILEDKQTSNNTQSQTKINLTETNSETTKKRKKKFMIEENMEIEKKQKLLGEFSFHETSLINSEPQKIIENEKSQTSVVKNSYFLLLLFFP